MRAVQRSFSMAAAAVAVAMALGISAGAQMEPCVTGGGVGILMVGIGAPKNDFPFSGTVKSTFEQKLADGNAIHSVTRTHQARDSAGRTMRETAQGCARGEDGQMREIRVVNVNDPVARTNMSWQVGSDDQPKVVRVFHQAEFPVPRVGQPAARPEPTPEELARQQKMMQAARAQQLEQRKETVTEDLGVKQIAGVSAQGTRITRTIPAGKEGNDQPLVVMNETWRSKELGATLMMIRDDPRTGRTVTEFEELNRGEPDPGWFSPPAGDKVQEQRQDGIMSGVGMAMGGVSY